MDLHMSYIALIMRVFIIANDIVLDFDRSNKRQDVKCIRVRKRKSLLISVIAYPLRSVNGRHQQVIIMII